MTLQQLTCLLAVVECEFSVSRAAATLHTSQPGVSRHIALIESELGVKVFVRERKRLVQLTPQGKDIVAIARTAIQSVKDLQDLALRLRSGDAGTLTVATPHSIARYNLPSILARFTEEYPKVSVHLRQGYGSQLMDWVAKGEAEVCICLTPGEVNRDVVLFPYELMHRILLVKRGHALLKRRRLSLKDIADYPILAYDDGTYALGPTKQAFAASRITPRIALRASDADVIKVYVKAGFGVAIVAHLLFDPAQDKDLCSIDVRHLIESSASWIGLRRHSYVPRYLGRFLELLSPKLTAAHVASELGNT